jgi:hypothetical protein
MNSNGRLSSLKYSIAAHSRQRGSTSKDTASIPRSLEHDQVAVAASSPFAPEGLGNASLRQSDLVGDLAGSKQSGVLKSSSAADLIRTRVHDESARRISRAATVKPAGVARRDFAVPDRVSYSAPTDRIATAFSPDAVALTAAHARQVHADLRQKQGALSKRVTAPSATESRVLLETMAFDLATAKANDLSNYSSSSTSKHADLVVDTQAAAVNASADVESTTTRSQRMMTRSPPPVTRIVHATQVTKQKDRQQHLIASDSNLLTSKSTPTLSTWQSQSTPAIASSADVTNDVTNQTERSVHSNYQLSVDRYQQEVSNRMTNGALTAAGMHCCYSNHILIYTSHTYQCDVILRQ